MRAFNQRNGNALSGRVEVAETLFRRMKGLLGRPVLDKGEALLIRHCKGIHTIGMRFPIDVIFLDGSGTVIRAEEGIPPNRLTAIVLGAAGALELPSGTLSETGTRVGDKIVFSIDDSTGVNGRG